MCVSVLFALSCAPATRRPALTRVSRPQLLLEHRDAYQAGAVFPDAFYPSICERGEAPAADPAARPPGQEARSA